MPLSALRPRLAFLFLFSAPLAWAGKGGDPRDVRFSPFFIGSVAPQPAKHGVSFRTELSLDNYKADRGTETLTGLHTRAVPSFEYRYAPGKAAELFFRLPYLAQSAALRTDGGDVREEDYAAGAGQPTVGFKLLFSKWSGVELRTAPPTSARGRDPRLGDGVHYGGDLLFKSGRWHFSAGHTARLPYEVGGATLTHRLKPGSVTQVAVARSAPDIKSSGKDFVGTVFELEGIHMDRRTIDGRAVRGSAALSGRAVFGFVLGRLNPGATHLTEVALFAGFGDGLHKTRDPMFGIADMGLVLGYSFLWD